MFANKHVVIAMLIAPVLAITAWFAVDYFVAERPHAAQAGATYALVASSNCRYDSGQCDLVNGDFRITLRASDVTGSGTVLELLSKFALQGATIGLVEYGASQEPARMVPTDGETTRWQAVLQHPTDPGTSLRVAVVAHDATYYAEVPVIFLALGS